MINLEKFSEYYRKYLDSVYEKMDSEGQPVNVQETIRLLPKDIQSVLCAGCGTGYEMKKIEEELNIKADGFDLNPLKDKKITTGDMHDIPFGDNSYDLVFAKDVLEHSFMPFIALSEFKRVAKKYIFIAYPTEKIYSFSPAHYSNFSRTFIMNLCHHKLGLTLEADGIIEGESVLDCYLFKK